jgi:hypothetical protein
LGGLTPAALKEALSQRRSALVNFLCIFMKRYAKKSHKNINQEIFENILKNTENPLAV